MKPSTNQKRRSRILLVDDHPLVRRALGYALEREADFEVCGEAEDRGEALALAAATSPHLAIVDLTLKTSDGLELIKDLRQKYPEVLTLVLSMHEESFYAVQAIRAGANGYISKQESPNEVMSAIYKVLRGEIYWPPKAAAETVSRIAGKGFVENGEIAARLSDRERQVFELIGIGSTPAQIAEIMDVRVSTVDTYRSRIKEKLSLKGATELRHEAIRWNVAKNARVAVGFK